MAKLLTAKDWQNAFAFGIGWTAADLLLTQLSGTVAKVNLWEAGIAFWVYVGVTRFMKWRQMRRNTDLVIELVEGILDSYIGEPMNEATRVRINNQLCAALNNYIADVDDKIFVVYDNLTTGDGSVVIREPFNGVREIKVTVGRRAF